MSAAPCPPSRLLSRSAVTLHEPDVVVIGSMGFLWTETKLYVRILCSHAIKPERKR